MMNQKMPVRPFIAAILCVFLGIVVNLWGCYIFGNSILNPPTEPKGQVIYGFLNIFLGLGIVVLAARYAHSEYTRRKTRSRIIGISKCPNCNADLNDLKSLKWKSWTVSQCDACGAHLKASRLVGGLSFLVGIGILFTIALPMITGMISGGHWMYGIILLIFCPAVGFWLLLNCNRYEKK